MSDPVNHPSHYNQGDMEVIEAIEGLKLGFFAGTILKYLARYPYKGEPLEDLEKAHWYLERLIKNIKDQRFAAQEAALEKEET
ncbi:MAG: DUF3310 domain-containing protein [Dehalococcoidales bacterium]